MYTADGRVLVRENLTDIYNMLNKERFYQTRRDCVLNLKYVQKIQNEFVIIMKNGDMLPLAQKKKRRVRKKIIKCFCGNAERKNI